MIKYGKTSRTAVSIMCFLARNDTRKNDAHSSRAIAEAIELKAPNVAKLLTILSGSDLIDGTPGPTGGYRLAKKPEEVSLHDIVSVFEDTDSPPICPMGENCCTEKDPCSLHAEHLNLYRSLSVFLESNTLDKFAIQSIVERA